MKDFLALPSHSTRRQYNHKNLVPSMIISFEGTGKIQLKPGHESVGVAPVLSHYALLRSPRTIPTGVLEDCR